MVPAFARALPGDAAHPDQPPRRILAICNNLGLVPEKFFPEQTGRDYALSPYLSHLQAHRDLFTVFSGVSHPDVDGGHPADNCFLTAAPHPGRGGFRNTISLDQYAAERLGHLTRFPSLTLGVNVSQGARSLSWTGAGVLIPCEEKASEIYRRLFLQGSAADVDTQVKKLQLGESIMDAVAGQARELQRTVGARDRERLDQYFTGVRELEQRMAAAQDWERKAEARVSTPQPGRPRFAARVHGEDPAHVRHGAARFQTDSTRLITLMLDSVNSPAIEVEGAHIDDGYHNLSHHGKSPAKLAQLQAIDEGHMKLLANLFTGLSEMKEGGDTLLDRSMILYGSNLGNANTHVTTEPPRASFAGGGFQHGQHLAFDRERNYPLPNLLLTMLQRLGLETDKFASSTGTMRGLEV
jgi:BMFP domain-containing protein YqiC